jgi:hypothetical protein
MTHEPMPVHGYTTQSQEAVDLVNTGKLIEELALRFFDRLAEQEHVDQRMVALARTHLQGSFMWAARSVFQPQRLDLDDDELHEKLTPAEP